MKSNFLLTTFLTIVFFSTTNGQTTSTDSVLFRQLSAKIEELQTLHKLQNIDSCKNCIVDSSSESGYLYNSNGHFVYSPRIISFWQWILVFLPVILFSFVLFYTLKRLKTEHYSLSEMLSDNEPSEIDVDNPLARNADGTPVAGQPAFIKKSVLVRSTSRMAAFISSICAVAIGTCSTSYYFYMYLKTAQAPNLDSLYDILLGLGIGVVPYAINKLAAAFK